jgi:hypothetical protein
MTHSTTDPGPSAGHQFRFAVTVQGSYAVGDDPQHYDSDPDTESEPFRLTVRAWSLAAACRVAAQTPLHQWEVDE